LPNPNPYKAALSICSDIDGTSTIEEFLEIQEFMNTKNKTKMGRGVGLEIGNSFFMFDNTEGAFSYFSSSPSDQKIIRKFINAGYLDVFHSFGESYKERKHAKLALKELNNYKLNIRVWVNHSQARSNLGSWFANNLGDNSDSIYYHSDITIPYGIKFVWLGSCTNIIGQCTPITLNTFTRNFDSEYFLKSTKNIIKETLKHLLSVFGLERGKYAMHDGNDLVKPVMLDDGKRVYEFIHYPEFSPS
jgi:hypothetical protein